MVPVPSTQMLSCFFEGNIYIYVYVDMYKRERELGLGNVNHVP